MSGILFEKIDSIGKITLNRPNVYNSFNREMALEMQKALQECEKDAGIRAIFITGEGKAFCAGQDLQEVVDPEGPALTTILQEHYNPIVLQIRNIEKPVVCAVNGVAAGAGANIALSCDITLAHENATFIQAFSKIGLIPDSGGTFFLPRLIGIQKAMALSILGEKVSAADAEAMGMIYKCLPADSFEDDSWKLAITLSKMPTKGLGYTKRAFNQSLTNNLEDQLRLEDKLQTASGETYDYKEGVQAFLEKRKPEFKGK